MFGTSFDASSSLRNEALANKSSAFVPACGPMMTARTQPLKNWSPWMLKVPSLTPGNKIRCSAFTWKNSPMTSLKVQTYIWELSPIDSQTLRSQHSRLRRNRVLGPAWMASRALFCLHSASLRLSKWGPLNIMLSRKQIIWPTLPLCPCRSENTFNSL